MQEDLASLQTFVVLMYSRTCPVFPVNKCKKYLFTKPPNKAIENCPPTLDSLIQHIRRAMLQSLIWMESLFNSAPIDITKYSWVFAEDGFAFPVWCTLQKASKVCKELVRCGCRQNCTPGKCSCKKTDWASRVQIFACALERVISCDSFYQIHAFERLKHENYHKFLPTF